jgi:probable F420-dependent oxidoreductase
MEYHVALPNSGPTTSIDLMTRVAEDTEEFGYRGLFALDHLLVPSELRDRYGVVYEPLMMLAHVARRTSSIRIGTSVIVAPMRNPFVLAKQVATLDIISGGRVVLGLGVGWQEHEFRNVGADFTTRASRTDETISLLKHLFSGSGQGFSGRFFNYDDGVFMPCPVQGDRLPILVGGNSPGALRRATQFADYWQSESHYVHDRRPNATDVDGFIDRKQMLKRDCERPINCGARILLDERGTKAQIDQMAAWMRAGADHVLISFSRDPNDWPERMRRFAREVIPEVEAAAATAIQGLEEV